MDRNRHKPYQTAAISDMGKKVATQKVGYEVIGYLSVF